jgi:hypothetical protein
MGPPRRRRRLLSVLLVLLAALPVAALRLGNMSPHYHDDPTAHDLWIGGTLIAAGIVVALALYA